MESQHGDAALTVLIDLAAEDQSGQQGAGQQSAGQQFGYFGRPAGFFSRLEAFIIDLVLVLVGGLSAIALFELIIKFFLLPFFRVNLSRGQYTPVIELLFVMGYFIFFWALLGFTPGKLLLGLKIVRKDGRKIGLGRSILRFIGYWVSAIPLFLGFIWIIINPQRRGWHDKIADTQVIYTWKKIPER